VDKIAEKAVCMSVFFLTTWHCILSAELTKNALVYSQRTLYKESYFISTIILSVITLNHNACRKPEVFNRKHFQTIIVSLYRLETDHIIQSCILFIYYKLFYNISCFIRKNHCGDFPKKLNSFQWNIWFSKKNNFPLTNLIYKLITYTSSLYLLFSAVKELQFNGIVVDTWA